MSSDAPLTPSYYPSVIISSDNQIVYAVNPATGLKNWQYALPADTGTTPRVFKPSPLVYGNRVYVTGVNSDTLYKLDSRTGTLIKKMYLAGHTAVPVPYHFFTMVASPIADGHLLYLATTNDTLYAIDTGTAAIVWKFGAVGPMLSTPTIYNNNIYCASTDGHVFCINKTSGPDGTGLPVWDYPGQGVIAQPIGSSPLAGSFVSSPSICAPYLYIGSITDSNMYCFYLTPTPAFVTLNGPNIGQLHWTYQTNGPIASSPATFAQRCIFGSNDFNIYCIDSQGVYIWSKSTSSQVNSSPIIDNTTQTVYIGGYDYFLYSINILDGSQKWKLKTNGLIKSSPVVYNGTVYVGSYDGDLYGVTSSTGVLKWKYPVIGNIECSPAIEDYSGTQYNSGISGLTN